MADIYRLFPNIQKQLEDIVERQDNLVSFEENVKQLARKNWRMYRGESCNAVGFGGEGFVMAVSPCCVCKRILGKPEVTENGFFFWSEINGDGRALCIDCYRRYWHDQNEPQPA